MLYLTLLSPVLAFPGLLFLEWLERWTIASSSGPPSEPWLRPEKPQAPPRAATPNRGRAGSAVQRVPLHSGLSDR